MARRPLPAKPPPRAELARQASMRGKSVAYLPPEALGGHKDLSEAWAAGGLQLADKNKTTRPDAERVAYEALQGRAGE